MTKEQKTIKKIQELVPEIMELKFGCKVKYIKTDDPGFKNKTTLIIRKIDKDFVSWEYGVLKIDRLEILGRDITLEDVLLAIVKKLTFKAWYQYNLNHLIKIWQFNKPFQDQSQECKDFIGDLLLKN